MNEGSFGGSAMRHALALSLSIVTTAAACAVQPTHIDVDESNDAEGGGGYGSAGGGDPGGGGSDVVSDNGLPCDVSFLLVQYCRGCHSDPPIAGASTPLMTYEQLLAPLPSDSSTTVAEESLARMRDAAAPMPPGGLLAAAVVQPFEDWVVAGMPPANCESDGTNPDPTMNPYDAAPTCTSGSFWGNGDEGSPDMTPGRACIACHSNQGDDGPRFTFSGTVYPTAHEPDDCAGIGGAEIEITDANGVVRSVTARTSGNFYSNEEIALPITARVRQGGNVLPMMTAVNTGDCNTCHTQEGKEGAPGRIILPW